VAAILEDEDVDSLEVDVNLMEAYRVSLRKASGNADIVDVAIISLKSAGRNLDVLSGAQLSDSGSPAPCSTPQSSSSTIFGSSTVVLLQEEYDRLRQLEFSQNDLSVTHASASGMYAYTASPKSPGY